MRDRVVYEVEKACAGLMFFFICAMVLFIFIYAIASYISYH